MDHTRFREPPASQHSDEPAGHGSMASLIAEAQAAWPAIELAPAQFAAYVRDRVPPGQPCDSVLRTMHVSDLYLACACVHGDAAALAAFDLHYLTVIDRALWRIGMDGDVVSEVKQRLRRALLVADDGPPRIAKFAGRGELRRWVRVLAVREALGIARQARREVTADENRLVDLVAAGASPELEYFKRVYRRELQIALGDAIRTLSARDRTLLRQHFLDGVSIIELGRLHRVHRATAGRWLEDARAALLAATRAHMMSRLAIPPAELESILRLVSSQLEVNLRPLFRQRP